MYDNKIIVIWLKWLILVDWMNNKSIDIKNILIFVKIVSGIFCYIWLV